jgi:hypothetical protein
MAKNAPIEAGFYRPAQWEKHEGTCLQWPYGERHKDRPVRLEHRWLAMTQFLLTTKQCIALSKRKQRVYSRRW